MRCTIALLPLLLLSSLPLRAQLPMELEPGDFHRQVKLLIEAHGFDLRQQAGVLQRQTQVLAHLTAAAKALDSPQTESAHAEAGKRLERAREIAAEDPPIEDPFPDVLDRVTRLLERRLPEPGEVTRRKLLAMLRPLEQHLLDRCVEISIETDRLRLVEDQLHALPNVLQLPSRIALGALHEVRREALRSTP